MTDSMVVSPETFPHGIRCADCDRPIFDGERVEDSLRGMSGDVVVSFLVCADCGPLGGGS